MRATSLSRWGLGSARSTATMTERAEMTDRHERRRECQETRVCENRVPDLQLRLAEPPGFEAHGQFADAVAGEHAAQHDLRHGGEAVRSEGDSLEGVAPVGPEQAGER